MRPTHLLLLLLLLFATLPATAQQIDGSLPDRLGLYRIDLPSGWQSGGRLIIYNHGLTMQQPEQSGYPSTAPSGAARDYWLAQGYALAAASYPSRGWALFELEAMQRALLAEFRRFAGTPGEVLLVGGSLGGLVSLRSAETLHADGVEVAGVYALCAPVAGARTWDSAIDTRLLYDAVCPAYPLPTGSAHLPWVVDYDAIPDTIDDIEDLDDLETLLSIGSTANLIRKCTGLFQSSRIPLTSTQRERRDRLKALLGISSDTFLEANLAYSIYVLADLIQAPEKLDRRNPLDNRQVGYGDPEIDATVLRVARDPLAAVALRGQSDFHGEIGNARVLALHTTRDELVVPEHLSLLAGRVPAERLATALVAEDQPAHCRFSGAEFVTGFEALRRWIDDDQRPDAADLKTRCEALPAELRGVDRCGFAAELAPASIDSRIRPRELALHPVGSLETGAWYDPDTDGEGAIVEVLDGGTRAVVAWYSYPPDGGEQTWIIGLGRVTEDGIHVETARQYRGARFGAFDPAELEEQVWGELTLWFTGCNAEAGTAAGEGRLRYAGPPAYGSGERRLARLSFNGAGAQSACQAAAPGQAPSQARFSGNWYEPASSGQGLQIQVDPRGFVIAIWYTFDPTGAPAWLLGSAPLPADGEPWIIPMLRPRGTQWGDAFDPAAVERPAWGELRLQFTDCNNAELSWDTIEPAWPDGAMSLLRLTTPAGTPGCGSLAGAR